MYTVEERVKAAATKKKREKKVKRTIVYLTIGDNCIDKT